MPEQRAKSYHRGRVTSTFTEEITAMLEGELSDPRIAPCHVTEIVLAPGGKSCRVFIAVTGNEQEEKDTLEGLMTARGFIRTEIRYRMGVRHVPELTFAIDRSDKVNARMDELFGRMEKRKVKLERRSKLHPEPAAPPVDRKHEDSQTQENCRTELDFRAAFRAMCRGLSTT